MQLVAAVAVVEAVLGAVLTATVPRGSTGGAGARPAVDPGAGSEALASLTVVRPLDQARALMSLPGLPRLFAPPYTSLLTGLPRPDEVRATLEQTGAFWPQELVIRVPRAAVAECDSLVRTFLLGALVQGAREAGPKGKKDLAILRSALTTQARALALPELGVSARFASDAVAATVWRLADGMAASLAEAQGLKLSRATSSIGVRLRLGKLLDARSLAQMVVDLGWAAQPGEGQAKALAAAIGRVQIEATLVRTGAQIDLSIGPPLGPSRPGEALPASPVPIAGDQLLAAARWEVGPWRTLVAGLRQLWAKWEKTPAGERTSAADEDDLLGDVTLLAQALDAAGDRGQAWLWIDHGVHALTREQGSAPVTPLAADPITALLPAELVALDVNAGRNLGQLLSHGLDRVENRLAFRSMRAPGEQPGHPSEAEQKEMSYYKNFAGLRELIYFKSPQLFMGASAVVMGPGARIARAELRLNGRPPAVLKDVAVPEVAVIGRARDPGAVPGFVGDAWAALGRALAASAGLPELVPRLNDGPPVAPGSTVRWFDSTWLQESTGESVTFDGGFKPHVAQAGDLVILSTSPGLTQRILALRSRAAPGRLALPAAQAPVLSWTRVPCAPFARQTGNGLAAIERMFGPLNFGSAATPRKPTDITQVFNLACELVVDVTEIGTQQADGTMTRYDASAAPGLYRR